jgi:hypothetical protein
MAGHGILRRGESDGALLLAPGEVEGPCICAHLGELFSSSDSSSADSGSGHLRLVLKFGRNFLKLISETLKPLE